MPGTLVPPRGTPVHDSSPPHSIPRRSHSCRGGGGGGGCWFLLPQKKESSRGCWWCLSPPDVVVVVFGVACEMLCGGRPAGLDL